MGIIFWKLLNCDNVKVKGLRKAWFFFYHLDVKEYLFCKGDLENVLKGLTNKTAGANSVVNKFWKYDGNKARDKLLKNIHKICEKEEVILELVKKKKIKTGSFSLKRKEPHQHL